MPVNYSALATSANHRGQHAARGSDVSPFEFLDPAAGRAGAAAVHALKLLGYEMVLVDAAGDVRRGSVSGPLCVRRGRIAATNELDSRRLQSALRAALTCSGGLQPVRLAGGRKVLVGAVPGGAMAMILMAEADPGREDDLLADLTEAERRLLEALIKGERLQSYAERNGIKLTTAKTHLQNLFAKSGQRRQADLIRWALSFGDYERLFHGQER